MSISCVQFLLSLPYARYWVWVFIRGINGQEWLQYDMMLVIRVAVVYETYVGNEHIVCQFFCSGIENKGF